MNYKDETQEITVSCDSSALKKSKSINVSADGPVEITCQVTHLKFDDGTEIVSIKGKDLRDRALIAQNKALITKEVLADRNVDPERALVVIDDGVKKEKMECRHDPLNRFQIQVKPTGRSVDLQRYVDLAEQSDRSPDR